ncbi:hypothetical protein PDESU_02563 [Pontiella desulfatans]|uniref:Uncharacterized protein n=1 Tax=Pontiella desulfatans TaxID=2750659 RepID=A0A6C2U3R2_PONDE|nr:hypothetical protein [Pontiella desulfatans]VGO14006.1 hypothetical protein PDESU_02563 [Pontiella desulfatans]
MRKRTLFSIIPTLALAAGSASAQSSNIFAEGFNSGFSSPYSATWGTPVFGDTNPGIITDGSIAGIEGDGFAAANVNQSATNGTVVIIGSMDVDTGYAIQQAGEVITFTGDFGWRYGNATTASDLSIHNGQSGFNIGAKTGVTDAPITFNYGAQAAGTLNAVTFSYTTVEDDVGETVTLRVRHADANAVANLTQLLTDNWLVDVGVPEPEPGPTNATLVVGVRADGLSYYYNPQNGASAYVNNGAIVEEDNTKVGDVIGALGYGGSFYSFGQVTSSTNTAVLGEYRVNHIPLTNVYHTVDGNIGGSDFTRNILTNAADADLIDFAHDGADFWFLADDGGVYQNSSTNAAFTFSNTVAGVYHSLSFQESKLVAGVTTDSGLSRVVTYDSGAFSTLWSQGGGAVSNGITQVAGDMSGFVFVSRTDGLVYEVSSGQDYFGNSGQWGGSPTDSALGLVAEVNSYLQINTSGAVYLRDVAKENAIAQLATLNGSGFVGLAVVDVAVLQAGYAEWSVGYGLVGGADDDDDGDELSNIYEYGLGGNPTNAADQGTLPTLSVSNGVARYTHVQLTDPNADIIYTVEQTPDLVNTEWTNANWSAVTTNITIDVNFDAVEYEVSGQDELFFRFKINQL